MDPIRFALNNPVKVTVGVLLILLFGFIALVTIPVQLTPDVDQPIITITTEWTGRSPEDVEKEIIEPQEDVLKDVSGLKKMTATAYQGRAEIELEFTVATRLKEVQQEVSDSLREVPEYPDDAEEPVINAGENAAESPIAWLILDSEDPDFDVQKLGDAAEDRIKPFLERVEGVSEVRVYGSRERQVHIEFDPHQVAQRRVTFTELYEALRLQNTDISAGDVAEGNYDVRIRTIGQYDDLDQVRDTIVAYREGVPVRIRDLAKVRLDFEKRRSFVRSRGQIALALPVYRESGANVIEVMGELRGRIAQVNTDLLPRIARRAAIEWDLEYEPKLYLEQVYDETVYIYSALDLVKNNLIIGGVLAVVALLLFLRSWRPTVVVAMAIPISIIGTFVVMTAFGRNVNVISLAGLAFAVGMVVDNAIVVLENIDRHLAMGKKPIVAAYDASREVWGAIVASTLTTLCVFIPVLTIQEEAGQLFRDIAIAICAAVTLSLIVSITVIPTGAGKFLREHREHTKVIALVRSLFGLAPLCAMGARGFAGLIYRLASPTPAGVVARLLIVGLFTIGSLGGAILLMPPTDYLPRGNQNIVFGFVLTPPGYNIEHNEELGKRVEKDLRPYWEAESQADLADQPPIVNPWTGQQVENIPAISNYFFVSFFGGVFNGATSKDPENVAPIAGLLTGVTNKLPGSVGFAEQRSLFGRGLGGSRSIDVEVKGTELEDVLAAAKTLMPVLQMKYGFDKVRPTPGNFNLAASEVQVRIDPVRARELNVDTAALGRGVQALVDGINVGDFRLNGESIDILAKRDPTVDLQPEQLRQLPLAYRDRLGNEGVVPLSAITTFERADSPQQIQRILELRAVTFSVVPPEGMAIEVATAEIDGIVEGLRASGAISSLIEVDYAGSASKLSEVRASLLGEWHGWSMESVMSLGLSRIFLALLVVYLLMAALFESFTYPAVIMFSVPLATVGGFLGLAITHAMVPSQQLDVLTMLGFVILIGVVVNNAILIVHQALNFMRGLGEGEGDETGHLQPREALRASVASRIRPIFMTTCTSVAGMLPLVLMPGSGSELYKGLGSVVVGGLVVSTLFTLIVVPLLFSLVVDGKALLYRIMNRELPELQDAFQPEAG